MGYGAAEMRADLERALTVAGSDRRTAEFLFDALKLEDAGISKIRFLKNPAIPEGAEGDLSGVLDGVVKSSGVKVGAVSGVSLMMIVMAYCSEHNNTWKLPDVTGLARSGIDVAAVDGNGNNALHYLTSVDNQGQRAALTALLERDPSLALRTNDRSEFPKVGDKPFMESFAGVVGAFRASREMDDSRRLVEAGEATARRVLLGELSERLGTRVGRAGVEALAGISDGGDPETLLGMARESRPGGTSDLPVSLLSKALDGLDIAEGSGLDHGLGGVLSSRRRPA